MHQSKNIFSFVFLLFESVHFKESIFSFKENTTLNKFFKLIDFFFICNYSKKDLQYFYI